MKTYNSMMPIFLSLAAAFVFSFAVFGCGDDDNKKEENSTDDGDTGGTDDDFECSEDKDGWEQCVDNKVEYCHIVEGMDPHFHWGADCERLGFECVEISESEASCLDDTQTCTVGDFRCADNTAYNCIEYNGEGRWAVEPCGTASTCTAEEGGDEAYCEEAESDFEPQDACDAITQEEEESKSVVTTFDDVFSADYHADLEKRVHVTLPDDEVSYIHFPVFSCGEFAVFLDQTGVFDGILHRDETEMTVSDGTAVGLCEDDIPEHRHVDLEWDGDGTEGESPVPYVIRFKAVKGGAEVYFTVFQIAGEDDETKEK
jgi:hypothetical protein